MRVGAAAGHPRATAGAVGDEIGVHSDLFHAFRSGAAFICPVSPEATIWAQSVTAAAANLVHALTVGTAAMPATRVVTLPAQRITLGSLAAEIARQCGVSSALVRYEPDAALEAAFGRLPPLATSAADRAGFTHDGDVATLVAMALEAIAHDQDMQFGDTVKMEGKDGRWARTVRIDRAMRGEGMTGASESSLPAVRRIVTGHDAAARAIFKSDDLLPTQVIPSGDAAFALVWTTATVPADNNDETDGRLRDAGLTIDQCSVIRIVDMLPGGTSPFHRTNSIDYGIVLSGEVELELDDGAKTRVGAGGITVQRGTSHLWRNTNTDTPCRIVFVLIEAPAYLDDGVALEEHKP